MSIRPIAVLALLTLEAGCGLAENVDMGRARADNFYAAVATSDVESILSAYAPEFALESGESILRTNIEEFLRDTGNYQSHKILNVRISKSIRDGDLIVVSSRVEYESLSRVEYLTFVGDSRNGPISHFIDSDSIETN